MLSVGGKWPDGTQAPLGDTIIWSGEDNFLDTTLPRFIAAGGDRRRFHCVKDVVTANGEKRPFDPARDVPRLCRAAEKLPELRYIIIDPVSVIVAGGRGASNNNAESRRALQPLVDLAEQRGIVVEGITHFTKDSGKREVLDRVIESRAFTAVARIVHVAHRFEDGAKPRRWLRIKGNIVKRDIGGAVGYEYEPVETNVPGYPEMKAPAVSWGDPLHGNAFALIEEERERDPGAIEQAVAFIETLLRKHGRTMDINDFEAAARANNITPATLRRARDTMVGRLRSQQRIGSPHAGWEISLVEDAVLYPPPAITVTAEPWPPMPVKNDEPEQW